MVPVLLLASGLLALVHVGRTGHFTIPTPFSRRPFEFPSGFRKTYVLPMLAYLLTGIGIASHIFSTLSESCDVIQHEVPVPFGSKPRKPENEAKKLGRARLEAYDLNDALAEFRKALKMEPKDPEIHFFMACA